MSNTTHVEARNIHGTNPQYLVEKILRTKIYQASYWKEHCFALTAETLVDKALELDAIGGSYGGARKPTKFICLVLKMLQIQPEKEIVVEFIKNEEYKYVRVLGAFYLRLTGKPQDVYQYLEPLYNDYRRVKRRKADGGYEVTHIDEFVDELLTTDYACDITLPFLMKREVLEQNEQLEPRVSVLEDLSDDDGEIKEEAKEDKDKGSSRHRSRSRSRSRSKDRRNRRRSSSRDRDSRDKDRDRDRGRSRRSRSRSPSRRRERSRDRRRDRSRDRDRSRRGRSRSRSRDRSSRRRSRTPSSSRSRSRSRDRRRRRRDSRSSSPRDRRRSRSRSHGRSKRDRSGSRDRGEEDKPKKKKKVKEWNGKKASSSAKGEAGGAKTEADEIAEANALRAKLGLKPLRI